MGVLDKFHKLNDKANIQPKSLYDFFKEYAIYRIPLYQRPYSWEKVHVNTLLDDIDRAMEAEEAWFLGPVFTAAESDDTNENRRYINLLDGQQRITTLYLIARVLYVLDYLFEDGDSYVFTSDMTEQKITTEKTKRLENLNYLKLMLFDQSPSEGLECKFQTDQSSREVLREWILGANKLAMNNSSYTEERDLRVTDEDEYLITKKNLNENIGVLSDYFESEAKKDNGLVFINQFTSFFLTELYFIHIPLREKNDVLDIFESINNRGKKLNLTDTIRFITIKSYVNDEIRQNKVNNEWSKFYKNVQCLNKYFNDSDVFLERYINSIAAETDENGKESPKKNGYTKDFDRIERFKEKHAGDYLSGMKKINHCLSTLVFIFSSNSGLLSLIGERTREPSSKVSALIKILELVFEVSQNSHVLFIGYLNRIHDQSIHQRMVSSEALEGHQPLLGFIWQFIKYVIAIEIYKNDDSNSVRNTFFYLAQTIEIYSIYDGENSSLDSQVKINGNNKEFVKNLSFQKFTGKQKKETTLLLYYFQFLHKYTELDTSSDINHKSCDHIMPDKWYNKACWKEEVLPKWEKIDESDEDSLRKYTNELNIKDEYVKVFIKSVEDLWNEKDSSESFIQLIGNKVYITGTTNSVKGNKCWKDQGESRGAKTIITSHLENNRNSSYIIPSEPVFHTVENFSFSLIIERTAFITRTICENSDKRYASINV